jgi:phenylalanyl-tRNA synthetase beta chain
MKFTLSWLKDHLETRAPLEQIVETLTRIGLEVEGVEDKGKAFEAFRVARVISAEQHPNADRLRVCMVDIGAGEPMQVVCGAPNARTGMKGVFAPPGAFIPGKNMKLEVATVRGQVSRGMLVSAFELQLSDDHEGIIDLPEDAPVGQPYAMYAGLDDPVIEIGLTPNRPDCTGVRGIARDLAAAGVGALKAASVEPINSAVPCPVSVTLDFAPGDEHLCPAFALRLVRGVRNGPAPEWMRRRLAAIGLRPINALVDITNYITYDRGRPLHVFDAKKVKGSLVMRRGRTGEELVALDGRSYRLDESIVVIADDNGPESIAGIMGGEHSGCDETTTDVLIESALWDPLNIAQSGRKLGIVSDARYRFERGVDPESTVPGLDLATRMVMDLCGGEPSARILAGAIPSREHAIDFPWTEVRRLSGAEMPRPEAKAILDDLGFMISGSGDRVRVLPPSWRPDVEGKADLVEEIIRIAGLDRIGSKPLPRIEASVPRPVLTPIQKRTRLAKRLLAARGLVEAVTWSFISGDEARLFGGGDQRLALANPIASELSDMRPSLLPGLIKAAQRNADRGIGDVALFEVGQCFASDEPEGQTIKAAAVRRGTARAEGVGRHWHGGAVAVDAFDAKVDLMALLTALGVPTAGVQVVPGGPPWFHPGRSGTVQFGPKNVIGAFGEVHPKVLKELDAKGPLAAFEITLDVVPLPKQRPTKVKPKLHLAELQPVTRDFAFVVPRQVAAADILKAAQAAQRQLIAAVEVFDVYEGPGIEADKKSVAIAVTLQPTQKTLTDAEIEAVAAKIVAEVAGRTGATLRS